LVICEPSNIVKEYPQGFLDQFGTVISCRNDLKHHNLVMSQTALPWHIGWNSNEHQNYPFSLNYDLLKSKSPIKKNKLLSVISSNKKSKNGHKERFEFVEFLKNNLDGKYVDFFGRGINDLDDKWTALEKYKYHLVIENSNCEHYWTEKLSDAFLSECYPIYYGCKNIYDYFDNSALSVIDIKNKEKSLEAINHIINSELYESKSTKNAILKAKEKCLDEYNFFPLICDTIKIQSANNDNDSSLEKVTLRPRKHFK